MADSGLVEGTSLRSAVGGQTPKAPTGQRWLPPNAREDVDRTELLYRKIRGYVDLSREKVRNVPGWVYQASS